MNNLDRNQNLMSRQSSILIEKANKTDSQFYRMEAPFSITIEYCDGSDLDSYVNTVTLSPNKSILYQQTLFEKNSVYEPRTAHFHDYYEFIVVLEGSFLLQIEGNDYNYSAGSCCLINRGVYHLEKYSAQCKIFFLGISANHINKLFQNISKSNYLEEQSIQSTKLYKFIIDDLSSPGTKCYLDILPTVQGQKKQKEVQQMIEILAKTLLFPRFGTDFFINGCICSLLSYISDSTNYYITNVNIHPDNDFLLFTRITSLLDESDGRLSRSDLESILSYSGSYLNQITHKYVGMNLSNYGVTFSLKKAVYYLKETDMSIQEIITKLRYTNRTHFYKLFKNKYGMTPLEYRLSKDTRDSNQPGRHFNQYC